MSAGTWDNLNNRAFYTRETDEPQPFSEDRLTEKCADCGHSLMWHLDATNTDPTPCVHAIEIKKHTFARCNCQSFRSIPEQDAVGVKVLVAAVALAAFSLWFAGHSYGWW